MNMLAPILYALSGAAAFFALLALIHIRFGLRANADLLNLNADFCVSFFKITIYCGTFTVEDGCPVLTDRKGIPTYFPITPDALKNLTPEDIAEAVNIPYVRRLRVRRVVLGARLGAGEAKNTVLFAQAFAFLSGAAFSFLKNREPGARVGRRVVPDFEKHSIKIAADCIIAMSIANIILSAAQTLYRQIRRSIREQAALRKCRESVRCRIKYLS
ncbi:hypothetical protein FACS1894211_02940 [Clostridia bacterium]|nr:hypothetical protein FACS1894211_02940 [Clostridia bacterium]